MSAKKARINRTGYILWEIDYSREYGSTTRFKDECRRRLLRELRHSRKHRVWRKAMPRIFPKVTSRFEDLRIGQRFILVRDMVPGRRPAVYQRMNLNPRNNTERQDWRRTTCSFKPTEIVFVTA